jgi:hypothetical protein
MSPGKMHVLSDPASLLRTVFKVQAEDAKCVSAKIFFKTKMNRVPLESLHVDRFARTALYRWV